MTKTSKLIWATLLAAGCIMALSLSGCVSQTKKILIAEHAAASTADAAMKGYAVYWKQATNNPAAFNRTMDGLWSERAAVSALSVKVGASIELSEALRQSALTNSAMGDALQSALATVLANQSNILQAVGEIIATPKFQPLPQSLTVQ